MGIRLLPGPETEFRVHWKTEAVKNKTQQKKSWVWWHTPVTLAVWRVEAGGMEVQSLLQLYSELKGSLTLMELSQRKKK